MKRGLIIILSTVFWLSACGGGGDRRAPPAPAPPPQKLQIKLEPSDFDTKGTPSSEANARAALKKLRQAGGALGPFQTLVKKAEDLFTTPGAVPIDATFTPLGGESLSLDAVPIAAENTQAEEAWKQGWTGKGVTTAIIDDFTNTNTHLKDRPHGEAVRAVAWQIAPEADMRNYDINLRFSGSVQNGIDQLYGRAATAFTQAEKDGAHIVNVSFGVDPYTFKTRQPNVNLDAYAMHLLRNQGFAKLIGKAQDTTSYHANMLFVIAAGNGARPCQSDIGKRTLDRCTIDGVALKKARKNDTEAGDRVMFVGALADEQNTMAAYSYTAGELKNDFIVAHDDIWQSGDGSGTSFAAPRVTGAAALVRHKFPNLNGPQLKQVLLQSADDLGAPGPDAVFGYGKLNIMSALSPIEGLTR